MIVSELEVVKVVSNDSNLHKGAKANCESMLIWILTSGQFRFLKCPLLADYTESFYEFVHIEHPWGQLTQCNNKSIGHLIALISLFSQDLY